MAAARAEARGLHEMHDDHQREMRAMLAEAWSVAGRTAELEQYYESDLLPLAEQSVQAALLAYGVEPRHDRRGRSRRAASALETSLKHLRLVADRAQAQYDVDYLVGGDAKAVSVPWQTGPAVAPVALGLLVGSPSAVAAANRRPQRRGCRPRRTRLRRAARASAVSLPDASGRGARRTGPVPDLRHGPGRGRAGVGSAGAARRRWQAGPVLPPSARPEAHVTDAAQDEMGMDYVPVYAEAAGPRCVFHRRS